MREAAAKTLRGTGKSLALRPRWPARMSQRAAVERVLPSVTCQISALAGRVRDAPMAASAFVKLPTET